MLQKMMMMIGILVMVTSCEFLTNPGDVKVLVCLVADSIPPAPTDTTTIQCQEVPG